jgi:rod shape-determining protein MreD
MTEQTRSILQMLRVGLSVTFAYAVFILLLLVLLANWALPYFSVLKPQLLLIIIYYWSLYRPTLMPPWAIFIGGLLLDLLNPVMPLGTHAASYQLVAALVKPRRRMLIGQSFMVVWVGFALVCIFDMVFKGLAIYLFTSATLDPMVLILNTFITILAFPTLVLVLVLVHRLLPAGRGMIVT